MRNAEPPETRRPVAPDVQSPAPSRKIGEGVELPLGAPSPMAFWNVPVSLYVYTEPFESGVDEMLTVMNLGVPLQSAAGEHFVVMLATLDATTLSLTSTPPRHSRRTSEVPTK